MMKMTYDYCKDMCERVENGYITKVIERTPKGNITVISLMYFLVNNTELKQVLSYAIEHNKQNTINLILNHYCVPFDGLSIKERISYYQLFCKE